MAFAQMAVTSIGASTTNGFPLTVTASSPTMPAGRASGLSGGFVPAQRTALPFPVTDR